MEWSAFLKYLLVMAGVTYLIRMLPLAAIRSQIASALDVMIHLGRERNKKRRVFWIVEVDGYEEGQIRLHTLYELGEQGLEKKGELKNTRKLWMAGEEI